jgi:hypothetical protein
MLRRLFNLEEVENILHTGNDDPPPPYSAWLKYWEGKTYQHGHLCSNFMCLKRATLGGHVKIEGDDTPYIIPLCDSCNKLKKTFYKRIGVVCVTVPSD